MAYVEFQKPPEYHAFTGWNYGELFAHAYNRGREQRAYQQRQEEHFQNNLKIGSEEGYFPQIQDEINKLTTESVVKQQQHVASGGRGINPEVQQNLTKISNMSKMGSALYKRKTDLEQEIARKKTEDPYYIAAGDEAKLSQTFHPTLSDPNKIGEHLNSIEPGNDVRSSFNEEKSLSDFVVKYGEHSAKNDTTDKSGLKHSTYYKGQFFTPNGTAGVTEEHVNALYNADPRNKTMAYEKAHDEMLDEIRKSKAAGEVWKDTRDLPKNELINGGQPFNVKDRPDNELFVDMYHNPEINPNAPKTKALDENGQPILDSSGKPIMTTKTMGTRAFEYSKRKLLQYEKTHREAEINAGNYDVDKERGITSKKYSVNEDFDNGDHGGPGNVLVNKEKGTQGIAIPVKGTVYSKVKKDAINTSGNMEVNATSYNYNLSEGDKPFGGAYKSTDDMIQAIKEMPDDQVKKLQLKTVIHGQAFNKKELSRARGELESLKLKSNKSAEDVEKISKMQEALNAIGIDPDLSPEVVKAALGVEVDDVIKVVDNHTAAQLKGKLGGFDITAQKNETPDMRRVRQAWEQKRGEVIQRDNKQAAGFRKYHAAKGVATPEELEKRNPSYTLNGKSYSYKELKKDYTVEEIQQAIDKGILK